jgi:Nucleoside recognition.
MEFISTLSMGLIPFLVGTILLFGTYKRVPTYEAFVEGGKEGIKIAVSLVPYLVGMLVSIQVFRASGAMDFFTGLFRPVMEWLGIPEEILPLAFLRPISGTAALGITGDLIATYGPDSFIGRLASILQGSTDTTLYIITVYFGAVGIKRMGNALKVGLMADVIGISASIVIAILLFGRG